MIAFQQFSAACSMPTGMVRILTRQTLEHVAERPAWKKEERLLAFIFYSDVVGWRTHTRATATWGERSCHAHLPHLHAPIFAGISHWKVARDVKPPTWHMDGTREIHLGLGGFLRV